LAALIGTVYVLPLVIAAIVIVVLLAAVAVKGC
jgi:hypothetical protein